MESSAGTPEVVLRPYQERILEAAKRGNALCVLATGLGKTNIAIRLAQFVKQRDADAGSPPRTTYFLVQTCNLVAQQASAARQQAPELSIAEFARERQQHQQQQQQKRF